MEDDSIKEVYLRDGYFVLPQLFTVEEVKLLKEEIKTILLKVEQVNGRGPHPSGVFVGLSANSEVFKKFAEDKRIVNVLQQIFGDCFWFLSDKVVFKSADTQFGSPWHQDWPYWEGDNKLSIWIALDDAVPENGCLKVIPGSNQEGFIKHTGDDRDGKGFGFRFRPEDIDEAQAVTLSVKAGSAVFFHDLLLHSSYPNTSGEDRWALISTYAKRFEGYEWAVAAFEIHASNK